MNTLTRVFTFAVGLVAAFLTSCASTSPQSRMAKRPDEFSKLSSSQQALVQQGKICEGMSMDAVWIAWGAPNRVTRGSENGKPMERWVYLGSRTVYATNLGMGYGIGYGRYGRHGRYCAPGFVDFDTGPIYVPYEAAVAVFKNGRLSSWQETER